MRILHTEWMRSVGGQAKRVLEELKIIKELGFTPYLATSKDAWLYKTAKKEGIEIFAIDFKGALDIVSAKKIFDIVKKYKIDIVHSHSSKDSYAACYGAKLAGKRYIRSRHMDLTKKPGLIYHVADAIITTGSKIKKELQSYGVEKPIFSIPSYPDTSLFFPNPIPHEKVRIGALTGLKRDKRPHLLLEALHRKDVEIWVAGVSNDKEYAKVCMQENFSYRGYVDPQEFLNSVDIYACPSKKEGIPQALMQAMACGLAVVSMDVGSIGDLNVKNNLLLAKNFEEFRTYLLKLIEDEHYRRELGEKNASLVKERFNRDILKKELARVYQSVL